MLCALAPVLPECATQMRVANAASIMIYLADKFGNEELLPKVRRQVCKGSSLRQGFGVTL